MRLIYCILLTILTLEASWSQTGIGTTTPNATLHIEPSSKTDPSGEDGLLIPRMSNFPGDGVEKGQLIYLQDNPNENEGFYYWDGTRWIWLLQNYDRTIDISTYIFSGSGYTGTGNQRIVNFESIDAFDDTGFSVSGNNMTIGKKGRYVLTFTSSVKRFGNETPFRQANFTYIVYLNNVALPASMGRVTASTSNEIPTATSAAFSTIINLQVGDVLKVIVEKSNEIPHEFQGYGTNGLTLTFLRD